MNAPLAPRRATRPPRLASLPVMKRLASVLLASLAVSGLVPGAARAASVLPGPVVGQPAPDFALTTVDGRRVTLAGYRGTTLVINVWGSWCPPCRLETPDLVAEANADRARGVAFLGVDTTEPASVVRAFSAAKGIPYPQVATTGTSAFARDYGIRNYPTTFVIGPDGVLRARHADNVLPRAQLQAYIAAARHGESAPLKSAFQSQLDAMLDPAKYPFTGDPASVRAAVAAAAAAIAKVNDLLDDAMDDPSRDHDLVATQAEEETLRAAAIAALAPLAASDADRALLARLRGDEDAALGKWAEADVAYDEALRYAPDDVDTLEGRAYAVSELGDAKRLAAIDARIAQLAPSYATFKALGSAQAKLGEIAQAEASFDRALQLAKKPAALAWTNLYYGRMESAAGNAGKARAAFERAQRAAETIPPGDVHREWYVEQAQEGIVALGVAHGGSPALSLAPWTGPDLPGSVASTYKYRLVVTGPPGARIALAETGLPAHWIGSFCSDRVCSPFRTDVAVPPDGVKIVEFQVVPLTPHKGAVAVRIDATEGGKRVATVGTPVAR